MKASSVILASLLGLSSVQAQHAHHLHKRDDTVVLELLTYEVNGVVIVDQEGSIVSTSWETVGSSTEVSTSTLSQSTSTTPALGQSSNVVAAATAGGASASAEYTSESTTTEISTTETSTYTPQATSSTTTSTPEPTTSSTTSTTPEPTTSSTTSTTSTTPEATTSTPEATTSTTPEATTTSTPEATTSTAEQETSTSSTSAATSTSGGSAGGNSFTGRATYYNIDGTTSCGYSDYSDSDMVCALNHEQYVSTANPNNSPSCGQTITVSKGGVSIDVKIVDKCPGCPYGGLDLSPSAFAKLADLGEGVIQVSWTAPTGAVSS